MILQIRDKIKGNASRLVIWVLGFVLVVSFLAPSLISIFTGNALWIARVNKQEIGVNQLRFQKFALESQVRQIQHQYADQPYIANLLLQMQGLMGDLDLKAFEETIRNELLNQSFAKLGIHLHEDHIADAFPFDEANIAHIASQLARLGIRLEDFEENVINGLKRELLYNLVGLAAYVPEFDLKLQFAQEYLPKQFTVLSLSFDDILQQVKQSPADQETLKQFYEQHKASYWIPEKRSATKWTFSPETYDVNITEQAIKRYYEKNKQNYVSEPVKVQVRRLLITSSPEARQTIEKIHEEAKANPEQFEQLVQQHSQDEETAAQGGLLPFISRGSGKDVAFERAVLLLQHDGQISDIIETQDGFEIVQRVARKPKEYKPLEQVEDDIRSILKQQKFASQFKADMAKLKKDPQQLKQFVADKKGKKDAVTEKAADGTPISNALFKMKKEGEFTAITSDNTGILVQLDTISQSTLPSFENVKEQVAHDYYEQKASKRLAELLEQAKEVATKKSMQEAQQAVGGSLMQTGPITKDAEKTTELQKQGVPVYKMLQIENSGLFLDELTDKAGYLVRLDEIAPFDHDLFKEKKGDLVERIASTQKDLVFKGFVASLYRNATIVTNKEVLKK